MLNMMSIVLAALPFAVIGAGSYLFWIGLTAWIRGSRQTGEPGGRLLGMVKGFRVGVIGLALIGIGVWMLTRETWILVVSLAVGAEELLESSVIIWAIRSDPRRPENATSPR